MVQCRKKGQGAVALFRKVHRIHTLLWCAASVLFVLPSCSQDELRMELEKPGSYNLRGNDHRIIDPDIKFSRRKFKENLVSPPPKEEQSSDEASEPEIPEMSELVIPPAPPQTKMDKLVSLSVTEDIPLKDVLLELARLADIDVELDPKIKGGIIFRVKDKPLHEVIDRISRLANLRYSFENNTLHIARDLPYIQNYDVDFLNLARASNTDATINTSVVSEVDNASKVQGSVNSGTTSKMLSKYDGDLWASITVDIANILGLDPKDIAGRERSQQTKVATTNQTEDEALTAISPDDTESLSQLAAEEKKRPKNFLSLNKQAGLIIARGTEKQQRTIATYLDRIKKSVSSQVLIEAKVVEVTLNQDYRAGINWDILNDRAKISLKGGFTDSITGQNDILTIGVLDDNNAQLNTAVSLTEAFGTTRTLSSPRLNAMNNQQAVLSFATNDVYFTLDVQEEEQRDTATNVRRLTVNSDIHTVPIGIIMSLQPSINLYTNEITLNIHPTLSRITSRVEDPGVTIIAARNDVSNVSSSVPVVEVRELDSTLKIKSGQVMVIGGLMEDRSYNTENGVPIFSTLPVLGNFFKGANKQNSIVETVIFIKATIVPTSDSVPSADKHLYNTFMRDPRPLTF